MILPISGQTLPETPQPNQKKLDTGGSENCVLLLEQSEKAIHEQDFPSAIRTSQRAVDDCQNKTDALLLLGRAQMLSKQFDQAIESLDELLVSDPQNVAALILSGQVQYLNNHDKEAEAAFQKASAVAPENPNPHYFLGRLEYEDGRIPQAAEQFQAAIKLDGKYYKAYDNLGLCYEAEGKNGLAIQNYTKALELVYKDHPEYDSVYLNLAEFMLKQDNDQKAFDLAAEAASRNPRNPKSSFLAGKALEQAGHEEQSLRWLQKAVQMDPAYPDPHYLLARIYRKQGKIENANEESATFKALLDKAPKMKR